MGFLLDSREPFKRGEKLKEFNYTTAYIKNANGEFEPIPAICGESAYQIAVRLGKFFGTEEEWANAAIAEREKILTDIVEKGNQVLSSIPDDYTAMDRRLTETDSRLSESIVEIEKNLIEHNCVSVLNVDIDGRKMGNGEISFEWNNNNNCTIKGVSTSQRFSNIILDVANLPRCNGKLYITYSSSDPNVRLRILYYKNEILQTDTVYFDDDSILEIPEDVTGLVARLNVLPNKNVNGTVYVEILGTLSNAELEKSLNEIGDPIKDKGILPDKTNLNDIGGNAVYLVDSRYNYENFPTDETSGFLWCQTTSGWTQQIYSAFSSANVYKRRGKPGGSWSAWLKINPESVKYATTGKYVAFGDSLTWGAVWGSEQGVHYTQAEEQYRIPTRIAVACGLENNFDNQGSSGAGYVKIGSYGDTITGNVIDYDYTGVSLITVMGGVNDKSTISLGTSDSVANDGTVCGAIKTIIEHIKTNAPKAMLIIIQPTPSGSTSIGINNNIWDGKERSAGWSLNDFDREVSKLCHDSHVGYVNWWESIYCDNWRMHSGGYNMETGPNYSHPRIAHDYSLLGNFIGGKVSALFKGRN